MADRVTGTLTMACGRRIDYDDLDPDHRAHRLYRRLNPPPVRCPDHGWESASCAVSGPAHLLWPHPDDYALAMEDRRHDHAS